MEQWINESLSSLLGFQVPDDLIQYIQSINNENDLQEYLKTLLDFDNPQHKQFLVEFAKKKFPGKGNTLQKRQKKKIAKNNLQQEIVNTQPPPPPPTQNVEGEKKGKTKTKYINLYSQEGKNAQVVLLKGRHHCDCQAAKHELVNNCLQCGRIVCSQEGSGPCLFCGQLVCTPEEQRALTAKTKASAKLMESLMDRNRPKGWEAAMSHRNRLLEYDRTSERRTRVTDDDSDYFNTNSVWLSSSEREKLQQYQESLHEKRHASRLTKKMAFDFAGRQIVEDDTIEHEVDLELVQNITGAGARAGGRNMEVMVGVPSDRDVAPGVNAALLQFDPSVGGLSVVAEASGPTWGPSAGFPRVQDPALQEMSDAGVCLSMHQPWASLLVEGIKMHEGRTWYSSHRGRLWIASTVKPPDHHIITALENQYRVLYPEKQLQFPSFYPTGCLLGCVNVDDCLNQEEYMKIYPEGESDSPYVFICSNPISLRLRFPIKGQHKIYKLDKTIHQAALKSIQRQAKVAANEARAG